MCDHLLKLQIPVISFNNSQSFQIFLIGYNLSFSYFHIGFPYTLPSLNLPANYIALEINTYELKMYKFVLIYGYHMMDVFVWLKFC